MAKAAKTGATAGTGRRTARLKVFRTPIGFHDAWVAAPSRKAALAAWGADRDLFARGVAEEVTDPAAMAAPLAQPGVVLRTSRGSVAEQLAALPATKKRTTEATPATATAAARPRRAPRPDRAALDAAEAAVATADRRCRQVTEEFDAREAELARERRTAERAARDAARKEARALERAQADYARAMTAWEESR